MSATLEIRLHDSRRGSIAWGGVVARVIPLDDQTGR